MRRLLAAVAVAVLLIPGVAQAEADFTADLEPGDSFTWEGAPAGLNALYFNQGGGVGGDEICNKDPNTYCEFALISFTNPVPEDDADGRLNRAASILVTPTLPGVDFDLIVYASDEDGTEGEQLGSSTQFSVDNEGKEQVHTSIRTTWEQPTSYILVKVIHFAQVGGYTGSVTF